MFSSPGQIKALKTLFRKLNYDDSTEDMALSVYGVDSCKCLTVEQARDLIDKLSKQVGDPNYISKVYTGKGKRGRQRNLIHSQAYRIKILEQLLGWEKSNTLNFIKRQVGANKAVEMLMNFEAVKVIIGMQRVLSGTDKTRYDYINKLNNSELKGLLRTDIKTQCL